MSVFRFHIPKGKLSNSPGSEIDLPDDQAAWREAAGLCRDLCRDVVEDFAKTPDWTMEVTNAEGIPLFRFRFVAETLT
jgi:hypothetical protein